MFDLVGQAIEILAIVVSVFLLGRGYEAYEREERANNADTDANRTRNAYYAALLTEAQKRKE